jgi:glycosyltransferase involved in cell wall biosynthesis
MYISISVIIPTKNRINFLERAVKSVLAQEENPNELIIVDDNLEAEYQKGINAIYEKYFNLIPLRIIRTNGVGASKARNVGAFSAKSEFIAFLDDDDYWYPEKLRIQKNHIKNCDRGCVAVFSKQVLVYSDFKNRKIIHGRLPRCAEELLFTNPMPATSTFLIKKKAFLSLDGFDIKLEARQDRDLWLRLITNYKVCLINKPLVEINVSLGKRNSITRSYNRIKGIKSFSKKWEKHPFLKNNKNRKEFWAASHERLSDTYISLGRRKEGIKEILKSLKNKFSVRRVAKLMIGLLGFPGKLISSW